MYNPDHSNPCKPHVGKHFKVLSSPYLVKDGIIRPDKKQDVDGFFKAAFKRTILGDLFWHLQVAGRFERFDYFALFYIKVCQTACKGALAGSRRPCYNYAFCLARQPLHQFFACFIVSKNKPHYWPYYCNFKTV